MTSLQFPNETSAYRQAREALLEAETELRAQTERVAAMRRKLPDGGKLKENYIFQELVDGREVDTPFSDLFGESNESLFVYSFMFSPTMDAACPMCAAMVDGLNGQVDHIRQSASIAVVAKHNTATLERLRQSRGWENIRFLSSGQTSFNEDYHAESEGRQQPMAHVFTKQDGIIRHFWSSELLYGPAFESGNPRHVDQLWPLWNVLDLTPHGRGQWYPSLKYSG